jgi:prefoldin alpha subunit
MMVNKGEQMDQRELLSLEHYLKQYGQQAEIFAGQLELMEHARMEALAGIEALQGLFEADDSTVLLQIGGGASVRAKVPEPDKVLLNIGAEVIVERTNRDAVEFLKDRITEMDASEKRVAEALDRLRTQMNEIAKRIEQGYQQSVQAERGAKAAPGDQDE